MALAKGINSYATVSEANAYFENRFNASAWDEADDGVKAQALVTATSILDSFDWQGTIKIESQALAFPRVGSYFDPKIGYEVEIGDTIPNRISIGTFELALHLLQNPDTLNDSGSVDSVSVSGISISNIINPSKVPSAVRNLIKPLLLNGGTQLWWRAN